jgi:ribonuclease P protein component
MISTKSRLPREDFEARGYKTISTPFFLLKTKKNKAGYPRIGIVIGKAVYKEAVKRNFWKRQAKAAFSKLAKDSDDLLIIFTRNKLKLTKKQFQEDMKAAITKIQ